jgi:hypothetical protein
MSNHLGDTNKMVSDTPRTDAKRSGDKHFMGDWVDAKFACQLERELNRACEMYRKLDIHTLDLVDRIMRLEEAGDAVEERLGCGCGCGGPCRACQSESENWFKVKEAKL